MQKKVWFTSDLHFEHKNIIKYCNRPWTFEEQTTQLVDRWNARVGMDDDVYCLGDFTFDNHKQFNRVVNVIKHLHGNIHFIKGNHCDPALWQMIEDANIPHVIWIKDYAEIKVDGRKIILSHFPFAIWNGTTTDKGYKLLDSHIGLIYGDSITTKRAEEILRRLAEKGFASGNIVFGIGSYTYQCNTRDTFGFAVKATNSVINGEEVAIYKDPKTDSKKKSAKGRLFVFQNEDGNLELVDNVIASVEAAPANILEVIFRDGEFVKRVTLDEIRARSV